MEELRQQQIETLEFAISYIEKLVPAFYTIASELKGTKQEDTIAFLNQAIEGLNLMIEVFNATSSIFNETEEVFKKDVIEENMQKFSQAVKQNDDAKMAQSIEGDIIPFLEIFSQISKVFLAKQGQ